MMIILQTVIFLIIAVSFISMLMAIVSFAPWIPSPKDHLQDILQMANIKSGERFYDLGCGDGRVVIFAAKHFGAKATGIELALPKYVSAFYNCLISKTPNANIIFGNLFKRNISDADVIYIYGTPHALEKRITEKLKRECKPGTRVISFMFEIKEWNAINTKSFPDDLHNQQIIARLYSIP